MKRAIAILLTLILLSGCNQTPEQVMQNAKERSNIVDNPTLDIKLEKASLSEISKTVENVLSTNYGSLILPKDIFVSDNKVYNLNFAYINDFTSKKEEVVGLFFNDIDNNKLILHTDNVGEWFQYGDASSDGYCLTGDFDGFIGYIKNASGSWDDCLYSEIKAKYNPVFEYSNDALTLNGVQTWISEQLDFINSFLYDKYAKIDIDFDFRITDIYVREKSNGENILEFNVARTYQDVDIISRNMTNDELLNGKLGMSMRIFIEKPNEICAFQLGEGIYNVTENKKIKEIITLDCAIRLLQKKLTGNSVFKLDKINLEYILLRDPKLPDEIGNDGSISKYNAPYSKLVWRFVFTPNEKDLIDSNTGKRRYRNRVMEIYIDAITGEIDDSNFSSSVKSLY